MAELEYEFTQTGLEDLRDEMEDLAEDTEEVGDRAENTATDLDDMASGGTDSAEDLRQSVTEVQEALQDLSGEASDTGASLEEGLETDPVNQLNTAVTELEGGFVQLQSAAEVDLQQIDASPIANVAERVETAQAALQDLSGEVSDVNVEQIEAGPITDIGDAAEESAADLEDMTDADIAALVDDMDTVERSINDVGGAAADTAEDIQRQFADASDQAIEDVTGIQERLEGLRDFEMNIGGGDFTADITSQLEDIDGSALTGIGVTLNALQNLFTGLDIESLEGELEVEKAKREVADLADEIRHLQGQIDDMSVDEAVGSEGIQETEEEIEDLTEDLEMAIRKAMRLDDSLTIGDLPLDDIEFDMREAGIGQPPRDPFEGVEKSADDAEEDVNDLRSAMNRVGENLGIGSIGDKLQDLGGSADDAGGAMLGMGGVAGRLSSKLTALIGTTGAVVTGIGALVGVLGKATQEMAAFSAQVAEAGQQLKVAEAQSGVAGQRIQELFLVAQQLDSTVDLDAIRDAFKELALRTEEAREGTGEAKEAFDRLGISMAALESMSTAEVFRRVRQEAADLTAQQRALTLEQIAGGEAGERLARVFGLTAEEFNRLKNSVADDTLTGAQIDALDEIRQQYTAAQQDLKAIKQQLVATFGGPVTSLFKDFAEAFQTLVMEKLLMARAVMQQLGMDDPVTVEMGPDEQMEFGNDDDGGDTSEDGDEVPEPVQAMNDALSQMETRVAVAKEKMSKNLIDKEEMVRQVKRARQSAANELLKLEEQSPDLIPDSKVQSTIQKLKRIKRQLERITAEETDPLPAGDVSADVQEAEPAQSTLFPFLPSVEDQLKQRAAPDLSLGGGLSALQGAAGAADSIKDINSLIEATRSQFDTLNNDEAQGFIAKLQKQRAEMKENQAEAAAIGDALARSVARGADRVFQALGQGISDAIFGGGGMSKAGAKLQLFNAKEQMRSLRESLRQGQISYRKFSLRAQMQQQKIQQKQEQLNDTMKGGFAKAADSMVSVMKKVAKQLIAEITAVIVKMLALKALTTAFSISSGGVGGAIISNLGGAAFLDSGASGGTVKQSGLAVIHEGEEIVPSQTVDTLKGLTQPSTPSVQPAMASSEGMNITVNVTGETRTDGRDLKTSYDKTTATQRRKGRK